LTIDVILSDLMMPGGTGLDLYVWLKEAHSRLADRLMVCSGGGPREILEGVTKNGIPFYSKPVDLDEIRAAIQKLVTPSEPGSPTDST